MNPDQNSNFTQSVGARAASGRLGALRVELLEYVPPR